MKTNLPPRNLLILVWASLMALMLTNFAVSHFNWGAVGIAVSLLIAFAQMALVVFYFMRLRQSSNIVRVAAAAGYGWLAIAFVLVLADYLTRQWH